MEGAAKQGEWIKNYKTFIIKAKQRKCGDCVMKNNVFLLGGDLT